MTSGHHLRRIELLRSEVPSFDQYPFSLPAIRHLDLLELHPKVTFLTGEKGSGKSTLLEAAAVAWGFNPEGGSRNFRFDTRPSHSELHRCIRLVKSIKRPRDGFFFRAESFFNVATEIEKIGGEIPLAYGDRPLHEQSHGESFLALVMNRFHGNGLYILDEPEAALSPQRQLSVLSRIHDLIKQNSQFLIATHSPILMAYPEAYIYHLTPDGIVRMEYQETEHYRVTRDFLMHPERMLETLLGEGE
jgi:predicted ATPase